MSPKSGYPFVMSLVFACMTGAVGHAMVYDGGSFSPDKVTTHTDFGSKGPEPVPTNFAYDLDRYSTAPVGVPFYVLGTDDRCYRGNFSYSKYEKVLIVYSKSPVASSYCIYQRSYSADARGFAISARDGGVCVPASAFMTGAGPVAQERGSPVEFSDCIADTISLGEYLQKSKSGESVASAPAAEKPAPDIPGGVKSAHEIARVPASAAVFESHTKIEKVAQYVKPGFTIQISSHSNPDAAAAKVKALKDQGVEAFVTPADVKGETWYRVCSGHYETWKAAKAALRSLLDKTSLAGAFVQKMKASEAASAH